MFPEHSSRQIKDNSWMGNIPDERFLNEITIPGTHDSGTATLVASVIEIYGRTQNSFISGQLNAGVRLFDLRIAYEPSVKGNLTLSHAMFFCRNCHNDYISFTDEVLGDIEKFLTENPTETVLIAPGYEDGEKPLYSEHMLNWFNEIKEKKTADGSKNLYYYETRIPKLGEVRGRIVIIRRKCFAYGNDDWKNLCENIGIHVQCFDSEQTDDENFFTENHYDLKPDPKIETVNAYYNKCNQAKIEYTPDGEKESKNKIKICFSSSNAPPGYGPEGIAGPVNKSIKYKSFEKGKVYGWWLMDFATSPEEVKDDSEMPPYYFYQSNVFNGEEPQTYISDLWVACVHRKDATHGDREKAMSLIINNRMYVDGTDIEAGRSRKFILMGHLSSGYKEEAITGVCACLERIEPTYNGWKWYPVKGNDQEDCQDLNRGICTNKDVFLYYTKDPAAGAPITEIKIIRNEKPKSYSAFREEGWDTACWNYNEAAANLKTGTGYEYIYCVFKRIDGSFRSQKKVDVVSTKGDDVKIYTPLKEGEAGNSTQRQGEDNFDDVEEAKPGCCICCCCCCCKCKCCY